jgi:hypothetical protein
MAFVRIVNTWRVSLVFQYTGGLTAVNTFSVLDVGGVRNAARATTIAGAFISWWNTSMKASSNTTVSLIQVNVLDLDSATGVSVTDTSGLPIAGTNSNAPAPQNAAPVVTLRSTGRGRSFRGRSFVVGTGQESFDTGDGTTMNSTAISAYTSAYTDLITAISGITSCNLAVGSRTLGTSVVVTSAQARSHIGTQRRRVKAP